jgi:hypothetical protein
MTETSNLIAGPRRLACLLLTAGTLLALFSLVSGPADAAQPNSVLNRIAAGTQQTLTSVPIPTSIAPALTNHPGDFGGSISHIYGAYTADGSPPVVVVDHTATLVVPGNDPSKAKPQLSFCDTYAGTGTPNGTGIDSSCASLPSGKSESVAPALVIPDWPTAGQQVYVWGHLPTKVQYVTYSFQKRDRVWATPINGTVVLSVRRPAAFDGSYAVWHSAPFPLLRAYDAKGHLVAEQYAPRIGGDRVPKVH